MDGHRLRAWTRVVVLAAVLWGTVGGADDATGAPPSHPPEDVLVVPGDATDGQVTVRPATQAPDDHGRLTWVLHNGGAAAVALALAVHEAVATDGAVEVGATHEHLEVSPRPVQLAPGEAARVRLPVPPDLAPDTIALVASGVDRDVEVVGLALAGGDTDGRDGSGGATVRPRVRAGTAGRLTVRLDAEAPALVDVAVRVTAWPGIVGDDHVVTDVLVPVGGRDVDVAVSGLVAGRVTVDVAVSGQPAGRTSTSLWWWPRSVLVGVALGLLAVAAIGVLVVRRRRGAAGAAGSA